jgi:hypothetical protein
LAVFEAPTTLAGFEVSIVAGFTRRSLAAQGPRVVGEVGVAGEAVVRGCRVASQTAGVALLANSESRDVCQILSFIAGEAIQSVVIQST